MNARYLIIHGHFYQPPRENPWIMSIEAQDSAAPFANWNLRINRECYAPNCRSRVLDKDGRINLFINNYERLSFNFGPTLLSWMEKADPDTYGRIIAADRQAAESKGGHGPALAQVYNHIIMPLANSRDKLTQIRWGLDDFQKRFGRQAEGLWLAETAIDLETLKIMASEGLKFTVLSQGQASAVRLLGGGQWADVSGGRIDPREPYRVFWGQGPKDYLDVFFYDGPVSQAIAFEQLLRDGATFLSRIEEAFGSPWKRERPRLVNLATDGESYGHHLDFGDMALAWLFNRLEEKSGEKEAIQLTNYGHFLSLFPPEKEVRIIDNSSWSCAHGVERWRADCGCNTGGGQGKWNQKWRAPLRNGLNNLRDQLADIFDQQGRELLKDPWAARNGYLGLVFSHYDPQLVDDFLRQHQSHELTSKEAAKALSLMESQLMSLYMFTSCGWFFDEISGLEPVQNLRYALRAIELAQPFTDGDLSAGLLAQLSLIKPNNRDYADGLSIWRQLVLPDSLPQRALAAHWAAAKILKVSDVLDFFTFPIFRERKVAQFFVNNLEIWAALVDLEDKRLGQARGKICLAVYSGGTRLNVLVSDYDGGQLPAWLDEYQLKAMLEGEDRAKALASPNMLQIIGRLMLGGASSYELENLLPHFRGLLLATMVNDLYDNLKSLVRNIFHFNQQLLMMNRAAGRPITWEESFIFRVMGEAELKKLLAPAESGLPINLEALTSLFASKGLVGLAKDLPLVSELGQNFFQSVFRGLAISPTPGRVLSELGEFIKLLENEHFKLDLWIMQNQWHDLAHDRQFISRLKPDEKEEMDKLGLALGFAPNFISSATQG